MTNGERAHLDAHHILIEALKTLKEVGDFDVMCLAHGALRDWDAARACDHPNKSIISDRQPISDEIIEEIERGLRRKYLKRHNHTWVVDFEKEPVVAAVHPHSCACGKCLCRG
jgi:hypothetical protein